jgi:formylmethanofuran dehydrogenase subunit E
LREDYGKTAFSFLSRSSGKGVRLVSRPGGFSLTPEHRALFEKVWSNTAGEEDLKEFWELHGQRTLDVLNKPVDDLYILQEIISPIPPCAKVFDSHVCGRCGESELLYLHRFM